jgi:para-aminobenzoate synthetase component 1
MIVDLERNDLSRVSKVGTVKVPELFVIEPYANVNHLVSTVVGTLKDECSRCNKGHFSWGVNNRCAKN